MKSYFWVTLVIFAFVIPIQSQGDIAYDIVVHLDIAGAENLAWSPDGTMLAVLAAPELHVSEIHIFEADTWEHQLTIAEAYVYTIKWSPDGRFVAGAHGGASEGVYIWDTSTGELLREFSRPHPDGYIGLILHDLAWHPNSTHISTDAVVDNLLVWELEGENIPQVLVPGYPSMSDSDWMNITAMEWSSDGHWLLTSGSDGNFRSRSIIRIYDAETGEIYRTIFPGFSAIWRPDNSQFAGVISLNGSFVLNVWDFSSDDVILSLPLGDIGASYLSWNGLNDAIAAASYRGNVVIWDVENHKSYDLNNPSWHSVSDVEWRPDSNQLAIAGVGISILSFDGSTFP